MSVFRGNKVACLHDDDDDDKDDDEGATVSLSSPPACLLPLHFLLLMKLTRRLSVLFVL
eukprot:CAMPEP_0206571878 /NCGR_PEP_ID=MMETSP0325_2-20121206/27910_1 /ASSEMBLY_ACC=CAM_ASM_000347 /TAXON_ID=2866 /ORGANISM="Crypthecodinium cohnii, Strain Seligo" /LENGTH=58 /DNA_ID=CAMNT_0054075971 /DNA_START=8 /DNA_END=184 /DNA_ORIENTATION=-